MGNLANGSFLKRTLGPEDSQKKKKLLVPRGHLFCTVLFDSEWVSIPVIPVIRTFTLCLNWRKGKEKKEKKDIFIVWFQRWKGNLKELKGKCFLWATKTCLSKLSGRAKKPNKTNCWWANFQIIWTKFTDLYYYLRDFFYLSFSFFNSKMSIHLYI